MALKVNRKRRSNKAVTPAISSVIITGVMVTLITVALAFASNFLVLRMAESDFNSSKQFMQTLGLQIDDVAWIIGCTETVRYSSRYGNVAFESALTYTIYINTTTQSNQTFYTNTTGIVCFNMPVEQYSISNGYSELIYPSSNDGFLLSGASAPVARVFAIEKLPMTDGSFVRVVVMPTIRMLNLSIGNTNYIRLYLPILLEGESPRHSQSVTLTGQSFSMLGETVTGVKIKVGFPLGGDQFNEFFFNLPEIEESISLAGETVLELYVGGVDVELGAHA
jgi:hypothetical protein